MQYLWKLKKAFMKELLEEYPEPKPAATTVATLLKRMSTKGYVGYKQMGNSRQYFPLVEEKKYVKKEVHSLLHQFFDNSVSRFASFFTNEMELTADELEQLKQMIEEQIKQKKP